MNKSIFKIIILLSIFLGIVSGLLTIVPYVGELVFILLLTITAPVIILFLNRQGVLEIQTVKQSVAIGGIIGFLSFLAFSAVYIPAVIVLARVFSYSANYGVSMFISHSSFALLVMFAIFMGVLSATINAFSGFVTYYLIEFANSLNKPNSFEDNTFNIRK